MQSWDVGRRIGLTAMLLVACAAGPASAQRKTASFDVTAVHEAPGGQVTISSKVWVTPTQGRADVKHPLEGDRTILVTNGFFYQLDPKSKKGMKGPLPAEMKKSPDNFEMLLSKFAFDASGPLKMSKKVRTETVSGYACDVFTNTMSQGDASRTITVWVPQKMTPNFPIKTIVQDQGKVNKPGIQVNQSYTVTITLSNIKVNTAIAPAVFAVPAGYKMVAPPAPKAKTAKRK